MSSDKDELDGSVWDCEMCEVEEEAWLRGGACWIREGEVGASDAENKGGGMRR